MSQTMPSKLPQFNMRLSKEARRELERLRKAVSEELGADQSYAKIVMMGLKELAKKYPPKK